METANCENNIPRIEADIQTRFCSDWDLVIMQLDIWKLSLQTSPIRKARVAALYKASVDSVIRYTSIQHSKIKLLNDHAYFETSFPIFSGILQWGLSHLQNL